MVCQAVVFSTLLNGCETCPDRLLNSNEVTTKEVHLRNNKHYHNFCILLRFLDLKKKVFVFGTAYCCSEQYK